MVTKVISFPKCEGEFQFQKCLNELKACGATELNGLHNQKEYIVQISIDELEWPAVVSRFRNTPSVEFSSMKDQDYDDGDTCEYYENVIF